MILYYINLYAFGRCFYPKRLTDKKCITWKHCMYYIIKIKTQKEEMSVSVGGNYN